MARSQNIHKTIDLLIRSLLGLFGTSKRAEKGVKALVTLADIPAHLNDQ